MDIDKPISWVILILVVVGAWWLENGNRYWQQSVKLLSISVFKVISLIVTFVSRTRIERLELNMNQIMFEILQLMVWCRFWFVTEMPVNLQPCLVRISRNLLSNRIFNCIIISFARSIILLSKSFIMMVA